jgi:general secretion pathway protein J
VKYFSKKGFSLIEMLAAMSMIALLAGSLYAAMNMGFKAKKKSEEAIAPLRAADIAFNIMGRDLQSALPPRGILAGPFIGETDSVSFFTRPVNTQDAAPGIVGVEYLLAADQDDEKRENLLIRNVRLNLLSLEEVEPYEEQLAYGVSSMEIKYFDGTVWLDAWDSTTVGDVLPTAVDVSLNINFSVSENHEQTHTYRRMFILTCKSSTNEQVVSGLTDGI